MQVLPFLWNRMPAHRLTVRSHAFAFGYSLAVMIVYQILSSFERRLSDNSGVKTDNLIRSFLSGNILFTAFPAKSS